MEYHVVNHGTSPRERESERHEPPTSSESPILAQLDEAGEALNRLREGEQLIAHCHLGLGKLYRRTGKRQEAHNHFTAAITMCRELDMRFWPAQAATELEALA